MHRYKFAQVFELHARSTDAKLDALFSDGYEVVVVFQANSAREAAEILTSY
jgi:hypothetical protein